MSKNYRTSIRICNRLDLDELLALLKLIGDQKKYKGPNKELVKALYYRAETLAPYTFKPGKLVYMEVYARQANAVFFNCPK